LGEQGRALVRERFGASQMVDQLYELYMKLVGNHASTAAEFSRHAI
jgi:hypothetical protein